MAKKIDVKGNAKVSVSATVAEALTAAGMAPVSGDDYGFKANTLVVRVGDIDVRIEFTTPKAGLNNYDSVKETFLAGE